MFHLNIISLQADIDSDKNSQIDNQYLIFGYRFFLVLQFLNSCYHTTKPTQPTDTLDVYFE